MKADDIISDTTSLSEGIRSRAKRGRGVRSYKSDIDETKGVVERYRIATVTKPRRR